MKAEQTALGDAWLSVASNMGHPVEGSEARREESPLATMEDVGEDEEDVPCAAVRRGRPHRADAIDDFPRAASMTVP